jgi:LuxR family maltose regulon positive regulatory protein
MAAKPLHRAWPVVEMADALLVGQAQMLLGHGDASHAALVRAVQLHARYRMPTIVGDPRISLAMLYQQRDQVDLAWQTFAPVLEDALLNDAVGPFLVEPLAPMSKLLALIPSVGRITTPEVKALLNRLALWHASPAQKAVAMDGEDSLPADLSSREREVLALLATGQSNKLIARALDLSLHTVKRHVANVLCKLGVASRGEAAARWRTHNQG